MKKISRRSFLAASAALGAAGVLTACGGGSSSTAASTATSAAGSTAASGDASADPAVTLVYAEVNPLDTIVGQTASYFKEQVESLSGGSFQRAGGISVRRVHHHRPAGVRRAGLGERRAG